MSEKIFQILHRLRTKYGYKCHTVLNGTGWYIHIDYINEGPEFDYTFPLELGELKDIPVDLICTAIVKDCNDIIYKLENEVEP